MSNMGSQFAVPKFDGKSSFTLWQRRMKDLLVHLGLARALKGDGGKLKKMSEEDWEEMCTKCASTIRLCISDSVINCVLDDDSPSSIWEKLEKLYMAKSLTNKLLLKRRLYRLRMDEDENLIGHVNMFNGLLDELKKIEVKLEEEDRALLLLNSLPDSYETYVDTILCGKDTITMEQAQTALLSFDARKKDKAEVRSDAMGTIAVAREGRGRSFNRDDGSRNGRSRSRGASKNIDVKCFKCGELGHIRRYCPKKCVESKGDTNLAAGEESSKGFFTDDGDIFAVTEGHDTSSNEEWILDSGCVNHICTKKDCFDELQECMTRKLSLPDNSTVNVMGVGVVKIKTSSGMVHTLDKVAYVPKLRHNLISLSQLDSNGYGYKAHGGALKVTKGNMVLMKGKLRRGLYRLDRYEVKTSQRCWKRERRQKVSFADEAAKVNCFQVADGRKGKIPAIGKAEGWRSLSRVK